jgi:hypothetical protein
MVPQFIILTAMSIALWLAARWVKLEASRVDAQMRRARAPMNRVRDNRMPLLRLDPETGRYYPSDR